MQQPHTTPRKEPNMRIEQIDALLSQGSGSEPDPNEEITRLHQDEDAAMDDMDGDPTQEDYEDLDSITADEMADLTYDQWREDNG